MRFFLALSVVALLPSGVLAADAQPSLKVFILAGQSNMEGKAKVSLLDYQAEQPETRAIYEPWRKDGHWLERDNVWTKFLDRKGKLTVGYGSPGCIGPELGFGQVVGDHVAPRPVLLIKTAWGGRSLYRDFRPPSAGLPADAVLEKMLADERKRKPTATLDDVKQPFGASYRAMLEETQSTLAQLKTLFPAYQDQGYEIAGLVWFQGWNDMINADYTAEYAANLKYFIHDVRRDLKAPKLPIVIGQMGVEGLKPSDGIKRFKEAQATAAAGDEFRGNVALVATDRFWDEQADAVFKKGWREHLDEWNKVGSDYPYHYLGSGKTMLKIGQAFGEAMLELLKSGAATGG